MSYPVSECALPDARANSSAMFRCIDTTKAMNIALNQSKPGNHIAVGAGEVMEEFTNSEKVGKRMR